MTESLANTPVTRPAMCPFCRGKVIDTLAKVLTTASLWRCRHCDGTWTLASLGSKRLS